MRAYYTTGLVACGFFIEISTGSFVMKKERNNYYEQKNT